MSQSDPTMAWADAVLATELFAVDRCGLGGICLRSRPGPARELVTTWVRSLAGDAPILRLPLHITDDQLLGGLSLVASLNAGTVVTERGLLARADGGIVIAAMAERLTSHVASHLCSALDRGELALEREGMTAVVPSRVGVVALDEGLDDERPPPALSDRLAFHIDLNALDARIVDDVGPDAASVARAKALLHRVVVHDDVVTALCQVALALGISSVRAPLLATAVARAHAALGGRTRVEDADAAVAARLVLAPRATQLPASAAEEERDSEASSTEETNDEQHTTPAASSSDSEDSPTSETARPTEPQLTEVVLDAAKSALPAGLLDTLALGLQPRMSPRSSGKAGALRAAGERGRPAGTRAAVPRSGQRLDIVATLRAAAPWQRLRRASSTTRRRVEVRKEDLRVTQFKERTETSVIFAVDASGSAALQRLAEAKGAVEQVLVDCYVRRDHVALVAFRGTAAALLLAPTRSLTRARRSLAGLAGGGTTPLAAGLDAAHALALDARKRGRTAVIVIMTDGRANVARDGREGSVVATADALASARAIRAADVRALFLDTAPRPRPEGRSLAVEMGARYVPLPYVDAAAISRHVQSMAGAGA